VASCSLRYRELWHRVHKPVADAQLFNEYDATGRCRRRQWLGWYLDGLGALVDPNHLFATKGKHSFDIHLEAAIQPENAEPTVISKSILNTCTGL
jgi:hypothetical protein